MRVQRRFCSLRHNFPLYSVNGDHDRTVRQHRRETGKKRALKNFMTYALQEKGGAMRVQRRFFHSGTIFRFTVLTETTSKLCGSIAVKGARKKR